VANFPTSTLEGDLWELFMSFGDVASITIVHKFPAQPIAFVDMKNPVDAKKAILGLDKQIFQGKYIKVQESTQKFHSEKYIYALLSFDQKECYIGETYDTKRRFRQHLNGKEDASTISWLLALNEKPKPVILEIVKVGYDTQFQANFLETAWRLAADRCCWKVINFPYGIEIGEKLEEAVKSRMSKWIWKVS
jgi:RNA recognition motif-containing protein